MRRFLCSLLLFALLPISCLGDVVSHQEITLDIKDAGPRTGYYTGDLNASGLPDGYGAFESVNPRGVRWIYVGQWAEGQMLDIGWHAFDNGQITISDGRDLVRVVDGGKDCFYDYDFSDTYTDGDRLRIHYIQYRFFDGLSYKYIDGYIDASTSKLVRATYYDPEGNMVMSCEFGDSATQSVYLNIY